MNPVLYVALFIYLYLPQEDSACSTVLLTMKSRDEFIAFIYLSIYLFTYKSIFIQKSFQSVFLFFLKFNSKNDLRMI